MKFCQGLVQSKVRLCCRERYKYCFALDIMKTIPLNCLLIPGHAHFWNPLSVCVLEQFRPNPSKEHVDLVAEAAVF